MGRVGPSRSSGDSVGPERPIDSITIGKRHRRDSGDLDSLSASIERDGLLHPVVIKPDGQLVAGERRLRACQAARLENDSGARARRDKALCAPRRRRISSGRTSRRAKRSPSSARWNRK